GWLESENSGGKPNWPTLLSSVLAALGSVGVPLAPRRSSPKPKRARSAAWTSSAVCAAAPVLVINASAAATAASHRPIELSRPSPPAPRSHTESQPRYHDSTPRIRP